ncbi:hypothetical protein KCU76_g25, partial [Aureobasidium melanogenum]
MSTIPHWCRIVMRLIYTTHFGVAILQHTFVNKLLNDQSRIANELYRLIRSHELHIGYLPTWCFHRRAAVNSVGHFGEPQTSFKLVIEVEDIFAGTVDHLLMLQYVNKPIAYMICGICGVQKQDACRAENRKPSENWVGMFTCFDIYLRALREQDCISRIGPNRDALEINTYDFRN